MKQREFIRRCWQQNSMEQNVSKGLMDNMTLCNAQSTSMILQYSMFAN